MVFLHADGIPPRTFSHISSLNSTHYFFFVLLDGSTTCGSSILPPNLGEKLKRAVPCPRSDPARHGPRMIRTCTSTVDMMASSANPISLPVIWPRTLGPRCPAEEPRLVPGTSIRKCRTSIFCLSAVFLWFCYGGTFLTYLYFII